MSTSQSTSPQAIADVDQQSIGRRVALFAMDFAIFAVASVVATIAITSGPRGAWGSIAVVALNIAVADAVLRPTLEWVALPPRWASTVVFLLLANAAFFGIADRVGIHNRSLHFSISGFWEALAGAVVVVALSILVRRVPVFAATLGSGERH